MNVLETLIVGVGSGLVASIILSTVMYLIKPRIAVSDDICRSKVKNAFFIKIVNKSRAALVDVNYKLYACTRSPDGIAVVDDIPALKGKMQHIARYRKKDKDKDYALRVSFDLEEFLKDSRYTYFELTIYAKHAVTGSTKFIRKFYTRDKIKCGRFQTGLSTLVIVEEGCFGKYEDCQKTDSCTYH